MNLAKEIKIVEKKMEAVKKRISTEQESIEKHSKLLKTAETELNELMDRFKSLQGSKLAEISKAAGLSFEELESLIQKNRKMVEPENL